MDLATQLRLLAALRVVLPTDHQADPALLRYRLSPAGYPQLPDPSLPADRQGDRARLRIGPLHPTTDHPKDHFQMGRMLAAHPSANHPAGLAPWQGSAMRHRQASRPADQALVPQTYRRRARDHLMGRPQTSWRSLRPADHRADRGPLYRCLQRSLASRHPASRQAGLVLAEQARRRPHRQYLPEDFPRRPLLLRLLFPAQAPQTSDCPAHRRHRPSPGCLPAGRLPNRSVYPRQTYPVLPPAYPPRRGHPECRLSHLPPAHPQPLPQPSSTAHRQWTCQALRLRVPPPPSSTGHHP